MATTPTPRCVPLNRTESLDQIYDLVHAKFEAEHNPVCFEYRDENRVYERTMTRQEFIQLLSNA